MAWVPTEKEIAAVLALEDAKRYTYFIKKVADQQVLWSLRTEGGWVLAGDDQGHELVPVWPHEKFAALCAKDEWAGAVPKSIELDAWLERWIPGMERDGKRVAIFPTPGNRGVAIEPARLGADLREELLWYE
jgi:hypothetical protein